MKGEWIGILDKNCKFYKGLRASKKVWFEKIVTDFIDGIEFTGRDVCVNDEIKVTVAGWAALMASGQPAGAYCFYNIKEIVIHAGNRVDFGSVGLMKNGIIDCRIHFAWQELLISIRTPFSSENIIVHELAHALDHHDRCLNGIPKSFLANEDIEKWELYFNIEYLKKIDGDSSLWDYFNLTRWEIYYENEIPSYLWAPVETFAVASEIYFMQPQKLYKAAPEIFYLLDAFYKQYPLVDIAPSVGEKLLAYLIKIKKRAIYIMKNFKM